MSIVKNEPKYKNGLLMAIRDLLGHRAFWLYLLCDEAKKRGLDPRDFGSAAVRRCGLSQGRVFSMTAMPSQVSLSPIPLLLSMIMLS